RRTTSRPRNPPPAPEQRSSQRVIGDPDEALDPDSGSLAGVIRSPGRHLRTLAVILALAALTVLYAGPLATPFLNDDYLFLEEARTRTLAQSLTQQAVLGNYFRPLSRELYFKALTPLAGDRPAVFHGVDYALFLGALALLYDLLSALLPLPGVMVGLLFFALIPFQRVNL